jgi:hypothetical protein
MIKMVWGELWSSSQTIGRLSPGAFFIHFYPCQVDQFGSHKLKNMPCILGEYTPLNIAYVHGRSLCKFEHCS